MKMEFDFDAFFKSLDWTKVEVRTGAETGMHDATDDLLRKSRDLAPLKKGTLRENSGKNVDVMNKGVVGEVYFNATEETKSGELVNYALITHELHSGDGYSGFRFKNPTTPGTQPKYLE
ncbi:HK97 gp10 family phage protein, partial [Paenibacillus alvei]|uniref:HK97 gp10 family phage protein n=1 Tax=Paenibacillus alvei TaxID=44250 RepID=UPI00227E83B8